MQLNLKLNARFQPKHRFELEDALQEILQKRQMGEITGGGTALAPDGEITGCDIEIRLDSEEAAALEWLIGLLNAIGIAKGSFLQGAGKDIPVGTLEGAGIYLNGTDLPKEIYQENDVNELIAQLEKAVEGVGRMYSYRELSAYTALYFYGSSFAKMTACMRPILNTHPLCQQCRLEQIA